MAENTKVDLCIYSPASRGGAGWFVSALVQSILDTGTSLIFISPEAVPADREPVGVGLERIVLIAGKAGKAILPVRITLTLWRIFSVFPALLRARLATREFVVTLYDWIPVLVAQMLWIKLMGGRLAFIVHDATPHAWAFPKPLIWFERWLYRLAYWLPDRLVSLTGALQSELTETWGRKSDNWVIPHGAYTRGVPDPIPGDNIVLIFGMLRRNKNILESIEAMRMVRAAHPDLRMLIAGAPHQEDAGYWDECEAALVGMEDVIRTEIGFVPEDRLDQIIAASDAVLLPYAQFNSQSGVAILSSLAERVLIVTGVGGIAELIDMGLEAVPIGQPVTAATIADALAQFAAVPIDERRRLARDTRAALLDKLSWQKIGEAYVRLILPERAKGLGL